MPDKILLRAAGWNQPPQTLVEYQKQSRILLESLGQLHSAFEDLTALGGERPMEIPKDFRGLEEIIAKQVFETDRPHRYLKIARNGKLAPDSLCRTGFSVSYCSHVPGRANEFLPVESGGIDLTMRGTTASDEPEADITLALPSDPTFPLIQPQAIRKLLALALQYWNCSFGCVAPYQFERKIRADDTASYAGQWLFYLPFPHLGECLPSYVSWEPFHHGILIQTTPHVPDPNDSRDVDASKRVSNALNEFGFINHAVYAIAGWPPDEEEWRYEEFISGAPRDRKYCVHCIDFDGYDARRNVLLYAKLFRRLRMQPKHWGLRGWDGPVLNEAKRQVNAAAKAGGVSIEWHIGLEEPAQRVRELLEDYTDITDRQLKVIHTPQENLSTK